MNCGAARKPTFCRASAWPYQLNDKMVIRTGYVFLRHHRAQSNSGCPDGLHRDNSHPGVARQWAALRRYHGEPAAYRTHPAPGVAGGLQTNLGQALTVLPCESHSALFAALDVRRAADSIQRLSPGCRLCRQQGDPPRRGPQHQRNAEINISAHRPYATRPPSTRSAPPCRIRSSGSTAFIRGPLR